MSDLLPEDALDAQLRSALAALAPVNEMTAVGRLDPVTALRIFDAQIGSRALDIVARRLRASGDGYYTIGSAGHEANAMVADVLRPDDPALLHYRSGAFYLARAAQVPGSTPVRDVLFGLVAAAAEPIAGGRHKVFGHANLAVIPQTSTIASHLPRALGVAFAIERARKLGLPSAWPVDAVAVASFGDASANHSTATGTINAASQVAYRGLPLPLLLVCEDNGLGISVPTPEGWIAAAYGNRPGIRYFAADGYDAANAFDVVDGAVEHVRRLRAPVFLHLKTTRFMGHAGTDGELGYRTRRDVAADYLRDPILGLARYLVETGAATGVELLARYDTCLRTVTEEAGAVVGATRLSGAAEIVAPLSPRSPERVAAEAATPAEPYARLLAFAGRLPEAGEPATLADSINRALADALARYPQALVFGEDVGRKGGVYGVTRGLAKRFGAARVFDTLLDEQSILGLALGAGVSGLLPIPEIQYLAYLHNAEDQLRGEAASLSFFSNGQFRNPMVIRVAGLAYQKGFGGHFHNDNAVAVLRDIPGLVVAVPSNAADAPAMLRSCLAAATVDGTVSAFLEPIALYHSRDLYEPGDNAWTAAYAGPADWADEHIPIGITRVYGDGADLTIATFGNGVPMSLRVARRLASAGVRSRVVDLRWLAPLPIDDVVRECDATGAVLVADETRSSGGVSEGLMSGLLDAGYHGRMARVTSADSYIPLGPPADHVLLSEQAIEAAAQALLES